MSSKCFAFHSSILFFSLFSCTLSFILALESGKKRLVVGVVVGNISCEWCPCLVTLEVLFNPNPIPIKPLTQPIVHCCHPPLLLLFVVLFLLRVFCRCRCILRSILVDHRLPYFILIFIQLRKSLCLQNEIVFIPRCRCAKVTAALVSGFVLFLLQTFPQFELC